MTNPFLAYTEAWADLVHHRLNDDVIGAAKAQIRMEKAKAAMRRERLP